MSDQGRGRYLGVDDALDDPDEGDLTFGVPPLTEAEYAATLPERADRLVAQINERLADELPEGLRFVFEPYCVPLDWKTDAGMRSERP